MPLKPLREMMKALVQLQILTEEQVRESTSNLPRDDNMILSCLQKMADKQFLTPYQVERLKYLDYQSLVLGGNKLLYENAAGSFARVFRGANLKTGQMVAIKILRNRWAEDEDTVVLFKREAEVGKRLKHPNIVPIYDIGFENDQHFFTMEFVEGGNLKDFIKIRGKLKPAEAVRYIIDIAKGLEYAISLGYTHRDLKPTNVLLSIQGVAKLIDFGLAASEETMKKVGGEAFINALEYNTLEKGTQAPRNDPRSDLFFMGVIFYELISGIAPYEGTTDRAERKRIGRYTGIRPLIQVAPECPKMVAVIIDRLLHASPLERYQSATEVLRDLKAVQGKLGEVDLYVPGSAKRHIELPYKKSSSDSSMVNQKFLQKSNESNLSDRSKKLAEEQVASSDSSMVKQKVRAKPDESSLSDASKKIEQEQISNEDSVIMIPAYISESISSAEIEVTKPDTEKINLLFLERREKEQLIIREYFKKHGFRVLLHQDPEKILARIKHKPPAISILMGEGLGAEIWKYVGRFKQAVKDAKCPLMVIAGKHQRHDSFQQESSNNYVLRYQPVTLRDMRKEIARMLKLTSDDSTTATPQGKPDINKTSSGEIDITKFWD